MEYMKKKCERRCKTNTSISSQRVELNSPFVNSVPWYNNECRCTMVDTQTMQSYNPFRGLHLICASPRFHSSAKRKGWKMTLRCLVTLCVTKMSSKFGLKVKLIVQTPGTEP